MPSYYGKEDKRRTKKRKEEKMNITQMRIDDRLIHGQIVTAWISATKATTIIVADDIASKDAMQQMLLKLTVPSGINLIIKSINETAKFLKEDSGQVNALLIVRNPAAALALLKEGFTIKELNVGNISNSKSETGRKCLLPFIYVEEHDVNCLRELSKLGVSLEIRAVPNDKSIDCLSLIKDL